MLSCHVILCYIIFDALFIFNSLIFFPFDDIGQITRILLLPYPPLPCILHFPTHTLSAIPLPSTPHSPVSLLITFTVPTPIYPRDQEGPIGLVMAPARELAFQIFNEAKRFSKALGIRVACVYGKCGLASMRDVVGSRGWRRGEGGRVKGERSVI